MTALPLPPPSLQASPSHTEYICVIRIQFRNDNCGLWRVCWQVLRREKHRKEKQNSHIHLTYGLDMGGCVLTERDSGIVLEGENRFLGKPGAMLCKFRQDRKDVCFCGYLPLISHWLMQQHWGLQAENAWIPYSSYITTLARWTFLFLKVCFATANL